MIRTEILGRERIVEMSRFALDKRLNQYIKDTAECNENISKAVKEWGDPNAYCEMSLEYDPYPTRFMAVYLAMYVTMKISWDDSSEAARKAYKYIKTGKV